MAKFFISYASQDRDWSEWIAWQLEEAGHTTVIQAWDFHPGADFVLEMQKAAERAERTIAVLSPAFLEGNFTQPEWAAAFAEDPQGLKRKLIPVRVEECHPMGLLKARVYIDLVGCDAATARDRLLAGVSGDRGKPSTAPGFPGSWTKEGVMSAARPVFPGPGGRRPERYRPKVRREYTELERHGFMKEAFRTILARFEDGIGELTEDHPHVHGEIEKHGPAKFTCAVYVDGRLAQQCKIWLGSTFSAQPEIGYAAGSFRLDEDNSYNEALHMADDPYELRLAAYGMPMMDGETGIDIRNLKSADAAEYLWYVFSSLLAR